MKLNRRAKYFDQHISQHSNQSMPSFLPRSRRLLSALLLVASLAVVARADIRLGGQPNSDKPGVGPPAVLKPRDCGRH